MKWMPKITKEIEKVENVEMKEAEPVSIKDVEQAIELINVANKINAHFKITFYLTIGEFSVDSDSFNSIKLMKKTKNEKDRIIISYYTALFSTETTIDINNIYSIVMSISFSTKEEQI